MTGATALVYECWGGPADGVRVTLDRLLDHVYVPLPVSENPSARKVYNAPPRPPYAIYRVGVPKVYQCQYERTVTV